MALGLIGLIHPTRWHIAISPDGGLYAMPSLCGSAEATRKWFRAFAAHSFPIYRPLRPRGVRHRYPERNRLSEQGRIDRAAAHALVAQYATIDSGHQHLGRREHLRSRNLELPALLDGLCRARADSLSGAVVPLSV